MQFFQMLLMEPKFQTEMFSGSKERSAVVDAVETLMHINSVPPPERIATPSREPISSDSLSGQRIAILRQAIIDSTPKAQLKEVLKKFDAEIAALSTMKEAPKPQAVLPPITTSWLGSDERFNAIKQLTISFVRIDLFDPKAVKSLRQILDQNSCTIDSLYLSHLETYAGNDNAALARYAESVKELTLTTRALVVRAEKDKDQSLPKRVIGRAIDGTVLLREVNISQNTSVIASSSFYVKILNRIMPFQADTFPKIVTQLIADYAK